MPYTIPSINSSEYELADFIELRAILSETLTVSASDLRTEFAIPADEVSHSGIFSDDDIIIDNLDKSLNKTSERKIFCSGNYPFEIETNSITFKEDNYKSIIYVFLLLSTRLNMKTHKRINQIDATQLFESLCVEISKEYFGVNSKSIAFGTSINNNFQSKITELLSLTKINGVYKAPFGSTGRQKDGHLDVVTWIPFSDQKDGQLIAMGQCKTGTTWETFLNELDPLSFFGSYTTTSPFVDPVRLFFVTEHFGIYKWEERSRGAGIIFDRCRIMQYLPHEIDNKLLEQITMWTKSAINLLNI